MNKFIRVLSLGFVLCFALGCISCGSSSSTGASGSGSSASSGVQMLCYTTPTAQTVRISNVFPIKTATPTQMLEEPWGKEFRTYVGQSGGKEEGTSVSCDQVTSKDAEKAKADELRKQGHTVIETGWAYAGG